MQPAGSIHKAVWPRAGKLMFVCWHLSPVHVVCDGSHELGITPWGHSGKAEWPQGNQHLLRS